MEYLLLMHISLVFNKEMFIYKNLMFGHESYLILLYLLIILTCYWGRGDGKYFHKIFV